MILLECLRRDDVAQSAETFVDVPRFLLKFTRSSALRQTLASGQIDEAHLRRSVLSRGRSELDLDLGHKVRARRVLVEVRTARFTLKHHTYQQS